MALKLFRRRKSKQAPKETKETKAPKDEKKEPKIVEVRCGEGREP
jgi:hypothetical protein